MGIGIGIGVGINQGYDAGAESKGVVLYDNFNRADNTSLGNATTGQTWTSSTFGISNNQAYRSSSTAPIATIQSGISDGYTQFQESALTESLIFQGVLFRYSDIQNFLRIVVQDGSMILQKREVNVTSTIASSSITRAVNNIYKVKYQGDQITVYVNGVAIINTTSALNNSATIVGLIAANTTTGRIDNFFVGAL